MVMEVYYKHDDPQIVRQEALLAINCVNNKIRETLEIRFNIYILLDGLSYNTRGYFASCVVFFRAPQGRGKMRAMSKMSASIIC